MATNNANNTGNMYSAGDGKLLIARASGQAIPANITAGTGITVTNGTNTITIAASGGGANSQINVTQSSHGFTVGQALYLNSTTYTLAKADAVATAEAVGIVSVVIDANNFTLILSGQITTLSGLTAGSVYWLSDATAGLLTTTQPSTVGNVQKPMLVAYSTTAGFIINYRGEVIPASNTQVLWNGISANTNLAANTGYYITGGGALTLTLPTTNAPAGSVIWIQGNGSTSWSIAQSSGQSIWAGNVQSTVGAGGSVASSNAHDGIYLVCTSANTTWQSTQYQGFLTVT